MCDQVTSVLVSVYEPRQRGFVPKFWFGEAFSNASLGNISPMQCFGSLHTEMTFGPLPDKFRIAIWNPPENSDPLRNTLTRSQIDRSIARSNFFQISIIGAVLGQGVTSLASYLVVLQSHPIIYRSRDTLDFAVILKMVDITHYALKFSPPRDYGRRARNYRATPKQLLNDASNEIMNAYFSQEGALPIAASFQNICLTENAPARPGVVGFDAQGMRTLYRIAHATKTKPIFIHIGALNLNMSHPGNITTNMRVIARQTAGIFAVFEHPFERERGQPYTNRSIFDVNQWNPDRTWKRPVIDNIKEDVRIVRTNSGDDSFILESRLNPLIDPGIRLRFGGRFARDQPNAGDIWNGRVDEVIHDVYENGVGTTKCFVTNDRIFPRQWI